MTARLVLLALELVSLVVALIGARVGSEWSARRSFCTLLVVVFAIAFVGTLVEIAVRWIVAPLT